MTAQDVRHMLTTMTTWQIDNAASRVEFAVRKRLMFVKKLTVTGGFSGVAGTITLDEQQPTSAHADVTIDATTINTQNARRDKHLLTAEFFDVARFPALTFTSGPIEVTDANTGRYRVTGSLTIHGVTREVILDTQYEPANHNVREPRMRLTLTGTLNRRDFGIIWNSPMINIADTITLTLTVEATRQRIGG